MQCRSCEYEAPARDFERYDRPTGAILRECPCCGWRRLRPERWAVFYGGGPWEDAQHLRVPAGCNVHPPATITVEHYPSAAAALQGIHRKARYNYKVLGVWGPACDRH